MFWWFDDQPTDEYFVVLHIKAACYVFYSKVLLFTKGDFWVGGNGWQWYACGLLSTEFITCSLVTVHEF